MTEPELDDESHDMQLYALGTKRLNDVGVGNLGSVRLKDRTTTPTNTNGELNSVIVQPNAIPWIHSLNKKNKNKSIILVGSWDKFGDKRFFYTTNNEIISGQYDEISLTGINNRLVVDLYIKDDSIFGSSKWIPLLLHGASNQTSSAPRNKMRVHLQDDNIEFSSDRGEQQFLEDVKIGQDVRVKFHATGRIKHYTSNSQIQKGTKVASKIAIDLTIKK